MGKLLFYKTTSF